MVDDIKLPMFKGTRSEDPKQFWFLWEVVWTKKQVHDEYIKKAQLVTTLRDRALTWYMKYSSNQIRSFADIKIALVK